VFHIKEKCIFKFIESLLTKNKGYGPDAYSRFCKVTSYGRFLYFEEDIMGIWSKV
jgi:hypothetical protein